MNDLLAGLGIALVIEGLVWAFAPSAAIRMVEDMAKVPKNQLLLVALTVVALGVGLVWFARG